MRYIARTETAEASVLASAHTYARGQLDFNKLSVFVTTAASAAEFLACVEAAAPVMAMAVVKPLVALLDQRQKTRMRRKASWPPWRRRHCYPERPNWTSDHHDARSTKCIDNKPNQLGL